MTNALFSQAVIAVIWDFDETLIAGNMQKPLFEKFSVNEDQFWHEVNELPARYAEQGIMVSPDTLYLNHILTYVKDGTFKGLNNGLLKELGAQIEFFPGLPQFFGEVQDSIKNNAAIGGLGIEVEHYVVSTGLRQMILGSKIAPYVSGVWGCEFIEEPANPYRFPAQQEMPVGPQKTSPRKRPGRKEAGRPEVSQIGHLLDNTTKTRAVFEINKGSNVDPSIDVNATVVQEDRRVPFQNMIYIADGPSDIPVFSILNQYGGRTFAVFPPRSEEHFAKVKDLGDQGRVQAYGEAVYEKGSQTYMWVMRSVAQVAERIAREHRTAVSERVHAPPGRVSSQRSRPAVADQEHDIHESGGDTENQASA